jgi:hypothetical protein
MSYDEEAKAFVRQLFPAQPAKQPPANAGDTLTPEIGDIYRNMRAAEQDPARAAEPTAQEAFLERVREMFKRKTTHFVGEL